MRLRQLITCYVTWNILVGPVGGIGRPLVDGEVPDLEQEFELYVRWWQLNTFMPMLHFLKPPTAFPTDKVSLWFLLVMLSAYPPIPRLLKFNTHLSVCRIQYIVQ